MTNSSNTPQEKAQCVTWYKQTGSITTVIKKFPTRSQTTASSRKTVLSWVRNFELRGSEENRNASGKLQ